MTAGFENDVEMYGAQTDNVSDNRKHRFENDVEMYGAQTMKVGQIDTYEFENDVEMYGAQTKTNACLGNVCLRMM